MTNKCDVQSLLSLPIPSYSLEKKRYTLNAKFYPNDLKDDRAVLNLNFEFYK